MVLRKKARRANTRTRKYRKRSTKSRVTKDKAISSHKALNKVNIGIGFPRILTNTLKYASTALYTVTGTPGVQQFRVNSLHDPDYTNTGHQPMFYDQFLALYSNWCVVRSRLVATFSQNSPSNTAIECAIQYSYDGTIPSNSPVAIRENQFSKVGFITPNQAKPLTLKSSWSGAKQWGKQFGPAITTFGGYSGHNPDVTGFWNITVKSADGTTSNVVIAEFFLEFDVQWMNLDEQTAS